MSTEVNETISLICENYMDIKYLLASDLQVIHRIIITFIKLKIMDSVTAQQTHLSCNIPLASSEMMLSFLLSYLQSKALLIKKTNAVKVFVHHLRKLRGESQTQLHLL